MVKKKASGYVDYILTEYNIRAGKVNREILKNKNPKIKNLPHWIISDNKT